MQLGLVFFGVGQLVLLVFGWLFFLPKLSVKQLVYRGLRGFQKQYVLMSIIFGVVAVHLIEVNFVDAFVTRWVGVDFASYFFQFEGSAVYSLTGWWHPWVVGFFVGVYIIVHPFMLWFAPLFFVVSNDRKALRSLAFGLVLIYGVALPFYLFLPVSNVYTFFGGVSALESVLPSINQFFYSTTTSNNCFPSLHVAMTMLVCWSVWLTGMRWLRWFALGVSVCVVVSVMYLAIHWITDVLAGLVLSGVVIALLSRHKRGLE